MLRKLSCDGDESGDSALVDIKQTDSGLALVHYKTLLLCQDGRLTGQTVVVLWIVLDKMDHDVGA